MEKIHENRYKKAIIVFLLNEYYMIVSLMILMYCIVQDQVHQFDDAQLRDFYHKY